MCCAARGVQGAARARVWPRQTMKPLTKEPKMRKRKKMCVLCKLYHSGYLINGKWKRDRQHDLCHRCYISLSNKVRLSNVIYG